MTPAQLYWTIDEIAAATDGQPHSDAAANITANISATSITGISIDGMTIEKYLRLNSNAPPNVAIKNANPTPNTPTINSTPASRTPASTVKPALILGAPTGTGRMRRSAD